MIRKYIISFVLLLMMPVPVALAAPKDNAPEICSGILETLSDGMDAADVTRTAIELGYSPCLVIKCAISGGGDLGRIVEGALQAGSATEVVSRCAISAGAEPLLVAEALVEAGISSVYLADISEKAALEDIVETFEEQYEPISRSSF